MFTKILDLDLDKYNLSLYQVGDTLSISPENIIYISGYLNVQNYPSEIVDVLGSISGVDKIEIFNKDNSLALISSVMIDN
jgi:hypothetical protein